MAKPQTRIEGGRGAEGMKFRELQAVVGSEGVVGGLNRFVTESDLARQIEAILIHSNGDVLTGSDGNVLYG